MPKSTEEEKEKSKIYYQNNKERRKAGYKVYYQKHKKESAMRSKKRNDVIKQATTKWYEKTLVANKRQDAKNREGSWQIDHIVPLQNDLVCGLHCNDNIRILTETQNKSKSNNFYV